MRTHSTGHFAIVGVGAGVELATATTTFSSGISTSSDSDVAKVAGNKYDNQKDGSPETPRIPMTPQELRDTLRAEASVCV